MRFFRWGMVVAGLVALPHPGDAQEFPRVTVRVRQVAGTSLYMDIGTRHGLATGDTLAVALDSTAAPVSRLVVAASTEARAVLTFAAEPFPITRGDQLTLFLVRVPLERPAEAAAAPAKAVAWPRAPAGAAPRIAPPAQRTAPRPHGRVALDVSTVRSVTQVGGTDPLDIERKFATPALRFDVTAPQAVGGFTLHTSARVAYRYSSAELLQPAASVRVYAASLERDFTAVPLRLAFGRFHSPAESYSGFWDGMLVRIGRDAVGVGAMVGFEPDSWNERVSTQRPKATVFMEGTARGAGWRWHGDVSAHTVRPVDSVPAHNFVGASQRVSLGPLYLSHDVQVDQHHNEGRWQVSRLRLRASMALGSHIDVRVGAIRRESYLMGRLASPFAPRRDRLDAGLGIRMGTGFVSADVGVGRDASGEETRGTTAAFGLRGLGAAALSGSVSRWTGSYGSRWSASPGLNLDFDSVRLRLGYRFNRSDYLDRAVVSHGVDASLDAPFGNGMRVSARGRVQWGGLLRSQGFDLTLYRIF